LHIGYEDGIKDLFVDFTKMQKKCGVEVTRAIKKRLNQLSAAKDFSEYLSIGLGKPHALSTNMDGLYAVSITGNLRLIISPVSADFGAVSLTKCDTILIKGVIDYHGTKNEWIIP
jgi:plasmid maintenance system killer protein